MTTTKAMRRRLERLEHLTIGPEKFQAAFRKYRADGEMPSDCKLAAMVRDWIATTEMMDASVPKPRDE